MALINPFSLDVIAASQSKGSSHSWDQNNIPEHRTNAHALGYYNPPPRGPDEKTTKENREKKVSFDAQNRMLNWKTDRHRKINNKHFAYDSYTFRADRKHHIAGGEHPEISVNDVHKIMSNPSYVTVSNDHGTHAKVRTASNTSVAFGGQIGTDKDGKPIHGRVIANPRTRKDGNIDYDVLTAYPHHGKPNHADTKFNRSDIKNAAFGKRG